MLQPGQYQLRDLVMGPGTVYTVKSAGLYDNGVDITGTGKKPFGHGSWASSEWATERTVPLMVQVRAGSETATRQALRALQAAFRPVEISGDVELRWRDVSGEYVLFGRPRGSQADERQLSVGISDVTCGFVAPSPFHYSAEETVTGPITGPTSSGGMTLPWRFPFSVGGRLSGGITQLTNEGTADAPLRLEVTGPAVSPWMSLQRPEGQQVLRFNLSLAAGQTLYVDTGTRSVLLNNTSSRRGDVSSDGGDWPILPGGPEPVSTPIRYFGDGTLTVRHRSAWW